MDDTGGTRSAYNWVTEKAQSTDPAHAVNALFVYRLPFGKDQRWGGGNAIVRAVAGNWQLAGITTYRAAGLLGSVLAACNLPNAGSCYASYNPSFSGPVRINGDYGSGDLLGTNAPAFIDKNAFVSPPAFTYGSTPRTGAFGLHGPSNANQNVSLRREFQIHEAWRFAFQVDAFNVFNWVKFAAPAINITSANFGKITAQSNSPRVVQFNARIVF